MMKVIKGKLVSWDDVEEIIAERDDLKLRLRVVLQQLEEVEVVVDKINFTIESIKLYLKDL